MTTTALATVSTKLPEPAQRRGITEPQWLTMRHVIWPGASELAVILAWDYCVGRRLDPLQKPVHIVPMEIKPGEWRDVPMLGVSALRTTAQRTGEYRGYTKPVYGPEVNVAGVTAPEYCELEMKRGPSVDPPHDHFPIRVYFAEVVAVKNGKANARWSRAPRQMLFKCTIAAGLREAFPDHLGADHAFEELDGQRHPDVGLPGAPVAVPDPPPGFSAFLATLTAAAESGVEAFTDAWKSVAAEHRIYLVAHDPDLYESLRARAAAPRETPPPEDAA